MIFAIVSKHLEQMQVYKDVSLRITIGGDREKLVKSLKFSMFAMNGPYLFVFLLGWGLGYKHHVFFGASNDGSPPSVFVICAGDIHRKVWWSVGDPAELCRGGCWLANWAPGCAGFL